MKNAASFAINNFPKLIASLQQMTSKAVFVGVPSETTNIRDDLPTGEPINNATLAYIQQNGSPAKNIPDRPFMTIGMDNAKEDCNDQLKKAASEQLGKKENSSVIRGLKLAGQIAENKIKEAINSNIQPALSEATLKARARRGRKGAIQELANRAAGMEPGSDLARTLVDTGAMRNSIKYVIRDNK